MILINPSLVKQNIIVKWKSWLAVFNQTTIIHDSGSLQSRNIFLKKHDDKYDGVADDKYDVHFFREKSPGEVFTCFTVRLLRY